MSDTSTSTNTTTKPLSYDDFLKIKKEIEKMADAPRPEIEFNQIWGTKEAQERMVDELGAIKTQEASNFVGSIMGIPVIEYSIPVDELWLIKKQDNPFELPKLVKIVKLGVQHER